MHQIYKINEMNRTEAELVEKHWTRFEKKKVQRMENRSKYGLLILKCVAILDVRTCVCA